MTTWRLKGDCKGRHSNGGVHRAYLPICSCAVVHPHSHVQLDCKHSLAGHASGIEDVARICCSRLFEEDIRQQGGRMQDRDWKIWGVGRLRLLPLRRTGETCLTLLRAPTPHPKATFLTSTCHVKGGSHAVSGVFPATAPFAKGGNGAHKQQKINKTKANRPQHTSRWALQVHTVR